MKKTDTIRKEFIQSFVETRRKFYLAEIEAGRMRKSEAAMGMTTAKRDAHKAWRDAIKKMKTEASV